MIFLNRNPMDKERCVTCPKCGGYEFTDIEPTNSSTYHVWCKKEGCKTDLLISVKQIKKGVLLAGK